eukprot:scaffold12978_cov51-Phaeocystis_antarctica.AAC.4
MAASFTTVPCVELLTPRSASRARTSSIRADVVELGHGMGAAFAPPSMTGRLTFLLSRRADSRLLACQEHDGTAEADDEGDGCNEASKGHQYYTPSHALPSRRDHVVVRSLLEARVHDLIAVQLTAVVSGRGIARARARLPRPARSARPTTRLRRPPARHPVADLPGRRRGTESRASRIQVGAGRSRLLIERGLDQPAPAWPVLARSGVRPVFVAGWQRLSVCRGIAVLAGGDSQCSEAAAGATIGVGATVSHAAVGLVGAVAANSVEFAIGVRCVFAAVVALAIIGETQGLSRLPLASHSRKLPLHHAPCHEVSGPLHASAMVCGSFETIRAVRSRFVTIGPDVWILSSPSPDQVKVKLRVSWHNS